MNTINDTTVTSFQREASQIEVISPLNGKLIANIPVTTSNELNILVDKAEKAFKKWSVTTLKFRTQIFFNYRDLLKRNIDELSELIENEGGKTFAEAKAEIEKAIELCEFATSLPQVISNEIQEVSNGVICTSERKPLGVVASITPFNFPSMVPHWTIPNALVLGNALVLKPSEKVPLSMLKTAELLKEAGLPNDLFTIVNGGKEIVNLICDHPKIKALSFVGSTPVAKKVYQRATQNLKRCLALGGAKNHLFVLPDAHINSTAKNITASVAGCCGQRCMAASVMLAIGDVQPIIDQFVADAKTIVPGKNIGAVISKEALNRIHEFITEAEQQGAKIILDGRHVVVEGKKEGFYIGPTIIDNVTPDMAISKEEVFGPVISIIRVKTLDEAIEIENNSVYGNAAAVFTQSGSIAKKIVDSVNSGMVGVNIGVPVPREPFSFGGWNASKFGTGDITGKSSIEFWTQIKKTSTKWD